MKPSKPRKNDGGEEFAPSVKEELKTWRMRAVDAHRRSKPRMTPAHVAVMDTLWTFTNTDTVNAGQVAVAYPTVATIMNHTAIGDPRTVEKVLRWLVERDIVWRVHPPESGTTPMQHVIMARRRGGGGSEERVLPHGLCLYGFHHKASEWHRARWAHSWTSRGCKVEGGRLLERARKVDVDGVMDRAMNIAKGVKFAAVEAIKAGEDIAAVTDRMRTEIAAAGGGDPLLIAALRSADIGAMAKEAAERAAVAKCAAGFIEQSKAKRQAPLVRERP